MIDGFGAFRTAVDSPDRLLRYVAAATATSRWLVDAWDLLGGTVETDTRALAKADGPLAEAADGRLVQVTAGWSNTGSVMLIDRLVETQEYSRATTALVTDGFPTPTLPRYATGEGVMVHARAMTTTSTETVLTVTYTNQAGVSGRTGICRLGSTSNYSAAGSSSPMSLQAGDTGVRSIQSVQLSVAAASGTYRLVMFRPLAIVDVPLLDTRRNFMDSGMVGLIPDTTDACLSMIYAASTTTGGVMGMELSFAQDPT